MGRTRDKDTTVDVACEGGTVAPKLPIFSLASSPSSSVPPSPTLGLATAARQWVLSSMLIRVPLHYLKRRGVGMVLLGMVLFTYLHNLFLSPSNTTAVSSSSTSSSSSSSTSRLAYLYQLVSSDRDSDGLPYQDDRGGWLRDIFGFGGQGGVRGDPEIAHILHRPEQGVAPLRGVDEDGLEIVDEAYLMNQHAPLPLTGIRTPRPHVGNDEEANGKGQGQLLTMAPLDNGDGGKRGATSGVSIQYPFSQLQPTTTERQDILAKRQQFVVDMIRHAWAGYAKRAAPYDELRPVSGRPHGASGYNGWAATAVGSLDTLLLAGLDKEFQEARRIVLDVAREHQWAGARKLPLLFNREKGQENSGDNDNGISVSDTINLYIGGLLSSAELQPDEELLSAAHKVGQTLLAAFQASKNALPVSILFRNGTTQTNPTLRGKSSLAETGSFQLEFRQLSMKTGDQTFAKLADRNMKFFMEMKPEITGLFPAYFDPNKPIPKNYIASFGSLSNSFYEYLLKTYMLTGELEFRDLYISAVDAMHERLISKPRDKRDPSLVLGIFDSSTESLVTKMDHMSCFAPGMLALGARVLGRAKDMAVARGLMETCYQSYARSPTGLGAEEIAFLATPFQQGKEFERPNPQEFYVLSAGYELRPETVESLFILYRVTGNPKYQEYAWNIAQAIERQCKTSYGYSTLINVKDSSEGMSDYMPSYFLSETLKYLYLIFSAPDKVSLDNVLFTTQGHLIPHHPTHQ